MQYGFDYKELVMSNPGVAIRRNKERLSRRRRHIRKKVFGTAARPRLLVYRSNKHIYAQVVDDTEGNTLVGCSTLSPSIKGKIKKTDGNIDRARIVGEYIAELALGKSVSNVSFDRNGKRYHGLIKALAEAARTGGLKF